MTTNLRFRAARAEDVPAIVALVESAYRGDASRAGWTTEADLLDGQRTDAREIAELLATPRARLVLAERDDALLGCVVVKDEGESAYLGMLSVRPTLQGGGVGRALVAEAERVARDELGRGAMRMTVITQRAELIAWYARLGYAPTGETEPFPYGDARFGLPRRDDLVFVVLKKAL
ncbi:GNAT family N-acetyltransferase [Sandaracinus amylolyticus]|uniref:GCN5-related N-acetyltransferase n=1 Tax=Sandaracinus amylolyticus TaxID=927083 RepID=A0A0F6VYM1_9BACT|nr:GNAT family N-acetyltransferase [Sandaracinus amylolyticus]AKF02923.1 GCN5-related N-acetyltransferase [Sandaracinus amylolyticus]